MSFEEAFVEDGTNNRKNNNKKTWHGIGGKFSKAKKQNTDVLATYARLLIVVLDSTNAVLWERRIVSYIQRMGSFQGFKSGGNEYTNIAFHLVEEGVE